MATNVVQMVLKLTDKASPSLKKTGDAAGSADTKFSKLTTSATKAGLGLAAVGVAAVAMTRSMIAMGQEVADKVNLITDMSVSTGLAVESLENLQLMARGTGVSIQGMERGFVTFARNLADARDGIGPLSEAMDELGFDANQFEDTDEAFQAVMKSIDGVKDSAQKARLMNDAFGMSSKDLSKAMQMQFGQAGKTLDDMGLRIGESAESASQAQRGLALYELVLDKIKRAAFESFLGGGGFAQGLSVVVGLTKGLATLLGNLKDITVGLFMGIAKGIYATQLLLQGEIEKSNKAAKEGQALLTQSLLGGHSLVTFDFISDAVEQTKKFQLGLKALGQEVKSDADLLAQLDKLQGKVASSAGKAAEAMDSAASAQEEYYADLGERTKSVFVEIKALNAAIEESLGTVAKLGGGHTDLGYNMEDMFIGSEGVRESLIVVQGLVAELGNLTDPLSLLQKQLMQDADAMGLLRGSSDELKQALIGIGEGYQETAAMSELDWVQQDADLSGYLENLQGMREVLASLLKEYEILAPAFASTTYGDNLKALIDALKADIAEEEFNIKAKVDDQSLANIRNSIAEGISLGASTMQSLAGGDVAGAAGGIAAAAGASPMVGAVISAIGALAEIGQMTVKEIKQNTKAFVKNLTNGIEVVVRALPEVIGILLKNLPAALIEAAFTWIPMLVYTLPMAIMEGFVNGFKSIMSLLGEAIRNAFRVFEGDGIRGTPEGESSYTGPDTSYYTGTASVARTGRALVHRGETIIPAGGREAQSQMGRMGGASVNINISTAVLDRDVIPRLVREIDRAVGTYGRTSAAFAGG